MSDIPISYLTPEECSTAASQSIPLVENGFTDDPVLKGLLIPLKSNAQLLLMSMAVSNVSEFTALIDVADKDFDVSFVSFRNYADASANLITKPERAKAAQTICRITETHGRDLHRSGKVEQIGKMNSLVDELKTPEMQKVLETADLLEAWDHTVSKHKELDALYGIRASAEKSRKTLLPPGEAKKPLAENLLDLYSHFMCAKKYVESYIDTARQLEEIFSKIIPGARARHSRATNDKAQKAAKTENRAVVG
jgi:hypothetical protein